MQTSINKPSQSEVEITSGINAAEFDGFVDKALKHFTEHVELPGFRKGRAPAKMVAEKVGEAALLEEAAQLALEDAYPRILRDHKIEAIGRPEIAITKLARGNDLEFKIKTAVMPELVLPDYRKIAQKIASVKEEIKVDEKEISEALEQIRKSRVGHKGEESNEDTGAELPELNDEFAKSLGKFENLDSLKKAIGENLRLEKEIKARESKRMSILEDIASRTELAIPAIMIEAEKDKMVAELKGNVENMGLGWSDYLSHIKKSEVDIKKEWNEESKKRIKFGMILREIGLKEKIEIPAAELDDYCDQILSHYDAKNGPRADRQKIRDYAYGVIMNEKVFQLLENAEAKNSDTSAPANQNDNEHPGNNQ